MALLVLFLAELLRLLLQRLLIVGDDHGQELFTHLLHSFVPLLKLLFFFLKEFVLFEPFLLPEFHLVFSVLVRNLQLRSHMVKELLTQDLQVCILHLRVSVPVMLLALLSEDVGRKVEEVLVLVPGMIDFVDEFKSAVSRWPSAIALSADLEPHESTVIVLSFRVIELVSSDLLVIDAPLVVVL